LLQQSSQAHRSGAGRGKITIADHSIDNMKLTKQFQLYESDHSLFIKALKEKNPAIEEGQRLGRALLWDKPPISLDEQERQLKSAIRQQPYVYQNKI
jgi:hypothetical protein